MGSKDSKTRVYDYVCEYIEKNVYSPNIREICKGTGLSSTSSVHNCLKRLEKEGKIVYSDDRSHMTAAGYKAVRI